ncbi:unnamed protein product [Orchesella dallaii]|uniref:SMB domain-containing protein n=1 Tax=Orchesella dallaii TaxID=48710 RepID=A0ABP1RDI2_9HEXA
MKLQNYRTIVISFTLLCFIQTYFATGEPNSNAFTSEEEWEVEFLELKNKSLINWKDGFKSCGVPMEGCGKKQTDDRDYFIYPSFCRCDKECIKYGDCCVTVLKELKKIPKEPSWRCVQLPLPNSKHAVRMISKCPTSTPYNLDKQLCEEPENCLSGVPGFPHVNKSHHCPLLDVPVLHKHTRDLYRSLFCARCHKIANKQLYKIQEEIICSEQFKQDTSWDEFKYRANYTQGKLEWVDPLDPRFTCTRQIKEFYAENIKQYVPNVRFLHSYS